MSPPAWNIKLQICTHFCVLIIKQLMAIQNVSQNKNMQFFTIKQIGPNLSHSQIPRLLWGNKSVWQTLQNSEWCWFLTMDCCLVIIIYFRGNGCLGHICFLICVVFYSHNDVHTVNSRGPHPFLIWYRLMTIFFFNWFEN